jgi:hypothetical protein
MGVKKSNGGLVGEKDFLRPNEIEKTKKRLMRTVVEGKPEEQREARGLLAQILDRLGKEKPTYVEVGQRDEVTGEVPIESGTINVEGDRVPDK